MPAKLLCSGLRGLSLASVDVAELRVPSIGGDGDLDTVGSRARVRDKGLAGDLAGIGEGSEVVMIAGDVELLPKVGLTGDRGLVWDGIGTGISDGGGDGP